ncbi:MAG: nuclear transport factor 2 family protein [Solirubrobacterales bacterium]|nr:nuclear transport factor 2 family protein [Solirubrobacterales bacterium]
MPRRLSPEEQVVRDFIDSFNRADLEMFVETLDPEVEIHSMKGLRTGHDAARAWATRAPGGVQQTVEVESVTVAGDLALAEIRRHWHWDEDGAHAATDEMAWLFGLHEGRVRSWRSFAERDEARSTFGDEVYRAGGAPPGSVQPEAGGSETGGDGD